MSFSLPCNSPADRDQIINLVVFMSQQQTADGLTSVWSSPFTWFDTGECVVSGLEEARAAYAKQFETITNLRTEILSIEAAVDCELGFAYSVQHFLADGVNGAPDVDIVFRQTDCVVKKSGEWKVVHQHVSLPADFSKLFS